MKCFSLLFFMLLANLDIAAQSKTDIKLLMDNISNEKLEKGKDKQFKGLLKIYNRGITDQIINDCIYQQSCSNFGQHSLSNYGFVKGSFITFDRLMRCNRLSQNHVLPVRINKEGKIDDPSHWYKR